MPWDKLLNGVHLLEEHFMAYVKNFAELRWFVESKAGLLLASEGGK
jgi:hypothetical protein